MILNNITNNQHPIPPANLVKPLTNESTAISANTMPINNRTIIEPNVLRKANNNIPPNYLRQVYMSNQGSSHGSLTESFIRSRTSFSPSYMHNEIATRYNMISAIPMKLINIQKTVDKIA